MTKWDTRADPGWGEDCRLCNNVGNLSEEDLILKLGEEEASEVLDYYHRRGTFSDIPVLINHIVNGYDA